MAQIFISYSRVDSAFVGRLIWHIQLAFPDLTIWYDQSSHGLIGGDAWWDEILRAIAASDVFVYVLSNESVQSRYCQAEFTEARRLQKPIVTVQARDRTVLTDDLSDIHFVDMKNGPDDAEAVARLVAAIRKQLEQARKRRPLWTPATPKPSKEEPPTRSASSPPIDTPPLTRPTQELKALRPSRKGGQGPIVAIVTGAILVGGLFLAVLASRSSAPEMTLGEIAAATLQARETASPRAAAFSLTLTDPTHHVTPEPTLSIIEIVATLDAQATAAARATDYAVRTITQAWIDSWTDTPTFTPTLNPLQAALAAARAFSGSNADWQALYPDGFQHAFEDGVTMVLVPSGCFMMGSEEGYSYERPVHQQCFAEPFWIDQTEVTQGQFAALGGQAARPSAYSGSSRPVENISWFEARDFCALRGARLPTEAEWEYAARGPDGWIYPWGNAWNANLVVWNRSPSQGTAPVGSIPAGASWVGALDMAGNVWEWTSSVYQSYPYDASDGREGDTGNRTDVERVLRSGSWGYSNADFLRALFRAPLNPDLKNSGGGFRCARSS